MTLDICPICKNNIEPDFLNARALDSYDSEHYVYGRCCKCDALILQNPPDAEDEVDYTTSGYYQRTQTKGRWLVDSVMAMFMYYRVRLVEKLAGNVNLKGKRLLDIGCGKGKFLLSAKLNGALVSGLEPTVRSFEFAQAALGDDVQNQMMSKELFPPNTFDIITMWHVFEHIPDPISMLNACASVLRTNGMLIISVPNYNGLVAKFGGATWFNLDPPRHVIHYSPLSLNRLLESNGFEVMEIDHHYPELTFFSTLQTLLNKMPITKNFLFNFLKSNKQAMPPRRQQYFIDMFLTIIGSIILAPFVTIGTFLLSFARLSDCITVSARKRDILSKS